MRVKLLIFTLFLSIIAVSSIFAGDAPTLLSPSNNTSATSSRLDWQTPSYQLYSSNPFRVQVDDDSSFSSINKDYYTSNTHYTPTLTPGTWYWKVKAKDVSGTWSNWSNAWSFTLADSTPTPTPTTAPTAPPTPSPTSSSTGSSSSSSFTISNIPSQINSNESFNTSVNLSLPDNPNTSFYLKGAFKKSDSSNYFGLTKVSGDWVRNSSTYTSQYKITTDSSGNWSGYLEVQPDSEDSGFTGSGDYIFKVGRYKDSDNSTVAWSNEFNINIVQASSDTNQGTTDQQTLEDTSLTSTLKSTASTVSLQPKTILAKSTAAPKFNYQIASVAGATSSATPSALVSVKSKKQTNPFLLTGVVLVFAGISSLGYIYLKSR